MTAAACITPNCRVRARHPSGLCKTCRARWAERANSPWAVVAHALREHRETLEAALWDAGLGDPRRVCAGLARAVERLRKAERVNTPSSETSERT